MASLKTFSDGDVVEIKEKIAAGAKVRAIAAQYGVARDTVLRAVDPAFRARRAAMIARNKGNGYCDRRPIKATPVKPDGIERRILADALRLMEQIPADTRCLTARIFGDPLPGRSAFDARYRTTGKDTHS